MTPLNRVHSYNLTEVYDVTVAYPDFLPSPEINLVHGHVPREVHYHIRRFTVKEILNGSEKHVLNDATNETLSKWLQSRWLEKEDLLKAYYAKPIGIRQFDNEISPGSRLFYVDRSEDNNNNKLMFTYFGMLNTGFWFLVMIGIVYLVCTSLSVLIYFVVIQLLFTYFTYYTDGINIWATSWITGSQETTPSPPPPPIDTISQHNNNNGFIHSAGYENVDQNKKAS
ncbi:unnamed protein product [Trichobilharzia regenti]|nr:unnamed protein product [Trichobilharzia regenti]